MSLLVRASALRQLYGYSRSFSVSASKNKLHNYDDYKPSAKPKTQEERDAAAKKYGLLPSEYEPYPDDDGLGHGDYPKLPDVAVESRDPFYAWDYPEHRRNFGEPVHAQIDLISQDRYNISMRPRYNKVQMLGTFLGIMTFFFALSILLEPYPVFRPVMEKQLPASGKVHYTFEPIDSRVDETPQLAVEAVEAEETD